MKQWITLIAATAIFASCSKDSLEQETEQQSIETSIASSSRTTQDNVYISGWEQGASWSTRDSAGIRIFERQVQIPQLTTEVASTGAVISFAKLMNTPEGFETYRNPQRLDFAFVPTNARTVKGVYLMRDDAAAGSIKLTYTMPAGADADNSTDAHLRPANFQFQHVVLPGAFLAENGIAPADVMSYTYTQLMDLIGSK